MCSARRKILLSGSALVSLLCTGAPSYTQTALPEIVVTAPSPIVRRAPPRPAPRPAPAPAPQTAAPAQAPAPAPAPTLPGRLPVVTDQFATVTVVPNEELRRSPAATLGDLLFEKPGITGSSFAPGASSRPIIRGLDVNRVGIVENGVGGGGVSDLREDHFAVLMRSRTNQVELIRRQPPSRYRSRAIRVVVRAR